MNWIDFNIIDKLHYFNYNDLVMFKTITGFCGGEIISFDYDTYNLGFIGVPYAEILKVYLVSRSNTRQNLPAK